MLDTTDHRVDDHAPETGAGATATTTNTAVEKARLPVTALIERWGIAAVGLLTVVLGWSLRWTADDAFINFRAVENFLAGDGMVFNAGQRVEVTTSPLWAYLIALGGAIPGMSLPWLSVILGLALSVTGVVLACLGCVRLYGGTYGRDTRSGVLVPFGALVFLALPPVWDFLTSGLETGLTFAWIGASFWGLAALAAGDGSQRPPVWLMVVIGLGPLIRPDLAVVTIALALYAVLASHQSWLRRIGLLAIGAALPFFYEIFRMGYYGLLWPNTAIAKESTRSLWGRGVTYLVDFVAPYYLWLPGLVVAAVLGWTIWNLRERRRVVALIAVVLLSAALHVLLVVKVGGDFMHGRLLLPGAMTALLPVFLVPITRKRLSVSLAALTIVGVWSMVCMASLRTDYLMAIGDAGIADERGYYVRHSGVADPVELSDHEAAGLGVYNQKVRDLQADGEQVLVAQPWGHTDAQYNPDSPAILLGPSKEDVFFLVGNAGFYGVGAGLDVTVVDFFGLADPVGAHMEPPAPGRPGHEKQIPLPYVLAMYGTGDGQDLPLKEIQVLPPYPEVDPDQLEAARDVLECGPIAELLAATGDEMSAGRFWDNLTGAVERTNMRISYDAVEEREKIC